MTPAELRRMSPGVYTSRCGTWTMQKIPTAPLQYTWMLTHTTSRDRLGREYRTLSQACEVATQETPRG